MIFDFTHDDDERALVEAARTALRDLAGVGTAGLDDPQQLTERRARIWESLVEQGWNLLPLPESVGGVDVELPKAVLLLEEAGRHLVPVPLVATLGLAVPLLRSVAADEASQQTMRRIAEGRPATVVWANADDPAKVTIDGSVVRGGPVIACDLDPEGLLIVVGTEPDGSPAATVIDGLDAVDCTPLPGFDLLHPLCEVDLDGCETRPLTGVSIASLAAARNRGLTLVGADLLGIAARALDLSVEHASNRTQFGQAIGAFQGVKHQLADVYVQLERARSLVYASACALESPDLSPVDSGMLARLAKAAASEAALRAGATGVQVHGALGITTEHAVSWLYRRARHAALLLGDHRHHYRDVGRTYGGQLGMAS